MLEEFLCGDFEAIPSLEVLRARRLQAWAYSVLPTGHPVKAACKPAFIAARARHELIKQEVLEMVRAWNAAGIEPLLYKGFALAEFAYPQPGTRFHGDVDVLVRPEDFRRALEIGHGYGWETPQPLDHWLFDKSNPQELSLKRLNASTSFDLHQRLVPSTLPWTGREQALTLAVWTDSRQVEWEGSQIRLLSPEDAFVFGLVISRCWSGDGWRLKSHDLLDGIALIRQAGLTRESVLARARTLNVVRTVNAFLERCDPFVPSLDMRLPSPIEYVKLELLGFGEHLPLLFARMILLALSLPALVGTALSQLPLWFEVRRVLRQQSDLNQVLASLEQYMPRLQNRSIHSSLVWWIARRYKQTSGLVWPLMVYIALRRQGKQAGFKLGEREGMQRAWVEVDGKPLPEFVLEHGPLEIFTPILTRG
jgi:hypothetical protein